MARMQNSEKQRIHIPLSWALVLGVLLFSIHPAATYIQEWRANQQQESEASIREMITAEMQKYAPQQKAVNPMNDSKLEELVRRLRQAEEEIATLRDKVSKLTSRLVSLAEAKETQNNQQIIE